MAREMLVAVLALATLVSTAQAVIIVELDDEFDDFQVVGGVSGRQAVQGLPQGTRCVPAGVAKEDLSGD
jgi:hypothetical protein